MEILFLEYMLRDFTEQDVESITKYANNRKIWSNLRDAFPHPYQISDAQTFISRIKSQSNPTIFAIATENEAIGSIGITLGNDVHRFTAEMGYWLAEPYWNLGITSKAVELFCDFAVQKWNLRRIFAKPFSHNPASAKVLEKAGFVYEGTLRADVYKDGQILDSLMYAKIFNIN